MDFTQGIEDKLFLGNSITVASRVKGHQREESEFYYHHIILSFDGRRKIRVVIGGRPLPVDFVVSLFFLSSVKGLDLGSILMERRKERCTDQRRRKKEIEDAIEKGGGFLVGK